MPIKRVCDLCLHEVGKAFLKSLKSSVGYQFSYLEAVERSVPLLADYSEKEEWPAVRGFSIGHIEDFFANLQSRTPWFGERKTTEDASLSSGYINAQHRPLNRFFGWILDRGYVQGNLMN